MFGANEPATTDDPRIAMIEAYLTTHPEYNAGEIISAEVTEIESKKQDNTVLGTLTVPSALLTFLADKGYGCSAGDVYNEVDFELKKYVQRVGSVDAGTLSWRDDAYNEANVFVSPDNALYVKNPYPDSTWHNLLCPKYQTANFISTYAAYKDNDNLIYLYGNSTKTVLCIKDNSFDGNATAFKSAMDGIMIYYELATPVEYAISAYLPEGEGYNLLLTEPSGSLTFNQNENTQLAVPQNLTWAIKNSEVSA